MKKKESVTIYGALSFEAKRVYWKKATKGNSKSFIQFLTQLHQNSPQKTLLIILDNSAIHKSKQVMKFLKRKSWLRLYYLPTYSPEYNPIELFWKWLKKVIYGAMAYPTIDALINRMRKVVWHYHEGNFNNGISFKCDAYKNVV